MPPKAKATPEHAQKRYTLASLKRFAELGMKGPKIVWKGCPMVKDEGYPPVKRGKGSSEYDPAKWGTPEFAADDNTVCMMKDIAKIFCLNPDDIVDLCFRKREVTFNNKGDSHIAHDYLASELERRAWEKFGGPEGLKIAREKRDQRVARIKATKKGLNKNDPANVQPELTVYYKKSIPEPQSPGGDVRIMSIKDKPPMVLCVGTRPPPSTPHRRNTLNSDYDDYEPDSDESDYYAEGGACDMEHARFMGFIAHLQSCGCAEDVGSCRKQQSGPSTPRTPIRSMQNRTPGGVTPNGSPPSSSPASVYTKRSQQTRRGVKRTHESSEEEDEKDDASVVESDSDDSIVPTSTPTSQREVPKTPIRDLTRRGKEKERRASQAASKPYSTPPTTPSRQVSGVSSSRRAKLDLESSEDEDAVTDSQRNFTPTSTPSKREAPKTPIRDLTRSGKERERERQARQAASAASESYSPSPSTAASRHTPGSSLVTGGRNTHSTLKRRSINSLVDSIVNDMPATPTRAKKMRRD